MVLLGRGRESLHAAAEALRIGRRAFETRGACTTAKTTRAHELTRRCPGCQQIWEDTPGCGDTPFLDSLWTAMDEAVTLKDCDVYSYKSDGEDDPFGAPRQEG